jgi:uncharacterized membrane protein HdeD (DUF308 family)
MVPLLGRHWWAVGLRGLAAILFGVLALIWPGLTLVVLVALFGAYALVDGLMALAATVRAATRHRGWGLLLLEGSAGIAIGFLTFAWPGLTALVLLYVIAAWALITGVLELGAAVTMPRDVAHAGLLGLAGIASVIFGVLLVVFPGAGVLTVVWLIGAYAIVFGLLLLGLAFRLRRAQQDHAGEDGTSQATGLRRWLHQMR